MDVGYHSGGCGRCRAVTCSGTGSAAPGRWKVPVSSASSMTGTSSWNCSAACSPLSPNIAASNGDEPRPTPTSSRPRLSWSSIAISSASRSGSYSGTTNVVAASRIRLVARAAAARNTAGDGASPSGVPWCSARW